MKRVLLILFILIIAAVAGIFLSQSPGYIFISFYNWSIETTLLTGAILILLLYIVLKGFILGFSSLAHIPVDIQRTVTDRRKQKSENFLHQGLEAYGIGDWAKSLSLMQKSLKVASEPLINYIYMVESAHKQGNLALRDTLISQAIQALPIEKNVLLLFHARLCIDTQQWKCALEILCPLWKSEIQSSLQPLILKYLIEVYENEANWLELIALLPKIKQHQIFKRTEFNKFTETIYVNALTSRLTNERPEEMEAFLLTVPNYIKKSKEWALEYNKYLNQEKQMQAAENLRKGYLT